jgi:hypothetical protein
MGWTFQPSQGRDRVEIIRDLLDYETDAHAQKVIDYAVVGTTVYLLVSRTPKAAWEPSTTYVNDADGSFRWIAVVLTQKARDAYDFGHKELEVAGGFRIVAFSGETAVFKATALSDERRFGVLQIARGNPASGSPRIAAEFIATHKSAAPGQHRTLRRKDDRGILSSFADSAKGYKTAAIRRVGSARKAIFHREGKMMTIPSVRC